MGRFMGILDRLTSDRENIDSRLLEWRRLLPPPRWRTMFAILWYSAFLTSSVTPGWKARLHTHKHHHGSLHIAVFFVTELITIVLAPFGFQAIACTIMVITLAFATEGLQKLVYGIGFEWQDLAVDIAGILTAALIARAAVALQIRTNPIARGRSAH